MSIVDTTPFTLLAVLHSILAYRPLLTGNESCLLVLAVLKALDMLGSIPYYLLFGPVPAGWWTSS